MKSLALLVAALLAAADAIPDRMPVRWVTIRQTATKGQQQPKQEPVLNEQTNVGCFRSAGELKMNTTIQFNSIGSCAKETCLAAGYAVGASSGGNQCWCGDKYPAKQDLVDDSKCNVPCTGFGEHACGGKKFWSVYNTGLTLSVDYAPYVAAPAESSDGGDTQPTKTAAPTSVVTAPGSTVVVTQPPTEEKSSGTNVAGIVAGVVVGVVVLAGAISGGFLYMRKKRNREIEEEHRRNAAVNAFIGKPPGSSGGMSMTDSRMDPVMAHRRMSDGSIADNQDYSRRILRVTNA